MARIRVSTTVDDKLLTEARSTTKSPSDSVLFDRALSALLAQQRRAIIESSYAAYDDHPLNQADEWGDLASFRSKAADS